LCPLSDQFAQLQSAHNRGAHRDRAIAFVFFFIDTATTEIYTLSLHDALPISGMPSWRCSPPRVSRRSCPTFCSRRSEEHTSELQSLAYLVCRLLLEKKKN